MSLTVHGFYCFPITDHEELIDPDHVSHKTPYDPSFRNHANQLAYFTLEMRVITRVLNLMNVTRCSVKSKLKLLSVILG